MPVGYRFRFAGSSSALTVGWFVAYSSGCEFQSIADFMIAQPPDNPVALNRLRTELLAGLNLHVVMPDGTALSAQSFWNNDVEPAAPVLTRRSLGGGGGDAYWRQRDSWYLWPLPPEGALTVAGSWPGVGIDGLVCELDATLIRSAGAESLKAWTD